MSDVVLSEIAQGVALLTLNRPDRLNAWTNEMHRAYFDLLDEAGCDDVRAIVVTGAGRGFCAGADMGDLAGARQDGVDVGEHRTGAPARPRADDPQARSSRRSTGPAPGSASSMRSCATCASPRPSAKFTTAFSRRGLIAEHGSSWLLPRLVGQARALDLLLSARRAPAAEEAAAMGLVDRAVPREAVRRRGARLRPRPRGELLADEHGGDEAADLGCARAVRCRTPLDDANAAMLESFGPAGLRRGRPELRRAPPAELRAAHAPHASIPGAPGSPR